jgi:tetratricopeptide (TPR) repeat protein
MSDYNYKAFISYSHEDEKWATWLHRGLERYRVPKHIVGSAGLDSDRLTPIFRDREELGSASSLTKKIDEALSASEYMIVVCSPLSAKSRWVNTEIERFIALGGEDRILCLIVSGEPPNCFPNSLHGYEPLAADAREHADGRNDAKLKIISGLIDINLGDLRQRELQRRQSRLLVVSTASIAGFIAMAALTTFALFARQEAETQRAVAVQESATSQKVTEFLIDLFEVSDPSEARGNSVTAREILDRRADTIEQDLAGEPAIQATIMLVMGRVHQNLGLFDEADSLLDRALERRRQFEDDDVKIAAVLRQKAGLSIDLGEYENAEKQIAEAITLAEKGNADPQEMAVFLQGRAEVYEFQAKYADAEADLSRALLLLQSLEVAPETQIADILTGLAVIYRKTDRYEEAKATFLKALDIVERELGPDHPGVSTTLNSLSILHVRLKEWDEAEKLMLRVIAVREKVYGAQHPRLALGLNNLAGVYIMSGRPEQAIAYLERALEIRESTLEPNHPSMGEATENLAVLHFELQNYEVAENWVKRAIAIKEASLDSDHPDLALSLKTYADILREIQRFDEAESFYLRALDIEERRLGADHRQRRSTLESYAILLRATGRAAEADEIMAILEQRTE